jgi:DNA-binding protein H-NS
MSDGNWKQIGPLDLLETVTEGRAVEQRDGVARTSRQKIKAQAYAQVCAMYRIKADEMTSTHKAYADAIERRMLGDSTEGKGYGFSISAEGRKPNIR